MKTIAIISQKGGSGKTTLGVHLAVCAELNGKNTVIIDLDPQASAATWKRSRKDETPDVLEAQLNAMMISVSREVVVVADSSKFQRRSLSLIAPLDRVHKIVTDEQVDPEVADALRAANVEVILA